MPIKRNTMERKSINEKTDTHSYIMRNVCFTAATRVVGADAIRAGLASIVGAAHVANLFWARMARVIAIDVVARLH